MKQVTIYDIARKLNLSAASVSRAINDNPNVNQATKQKILEAAAAMGYSVNKFAQNLRTKTGSKLIGVILHKLDSQFTINVLYGIENIVKNAGYDLIICHSSEDHKQEIVNASNLFQRRVEGLIVGLSSDVDTADHFKKYIDKGIPVILFDRVKADFPGIKVVIDNYSAAFNATSHLIEQGCSRIAHIGGKQNSSVYIDRLRGYKQALKEHGISVDPTLIFFEGLDSNAGQRIAEIIANRSILPDAVFSVNDLTAVTCMKALQRKGIEIPADIAFVGFNNDFTSTIIEPNLSTIEYSGVVMGETVAGLLIEEIKNNPANKSNYVHILKSSLIIRASSKKK